MTSQEINEQFSQKSAKYRNDINQNMSKLQTVGDKYSYNVTIPGINSFKGSNFIRPPIIGDQF